MKNLITCLVVCLLGGVAFAQTPNMVDNFKLSTSRGSTDNNSGCMDCCGTKLTPERIIQTQKMLADGTWDEGRSRLLDPRGVDTQFVKLTIHIVRYSDGTGGIPESRISTAISDLNNHVASTGLVFFQHVNTIYLDSDQYADCTSDESYALRAINPVSSSVNIWFVPNFIGLCGKSSFPGSSTQGIVMDNDCTATTYNHSTFTHEVGHYFNLYHTHTTYLGGAECVDGSNCSTAGDLFCDTPADPNLSGVVDNFCNYYGTYTDACGSGNPYVPATDNLMSYSQKWCRDVFTQEQLSMFLYTAETNRADHLLPFSTGACCNESDSCITTYEYICENAGWNWQGLGTNCADGCLQNTPGACCVGTAGGCIDNLLESTCLAGSGTWLGPNTVCADGECKSPSCEADIDGDNAVNVADLLMVIDQWGQTNSPADINADGIVNVSDLLVVIDNWGACE
jgi:hypothetical protein